MSNTSGKTVFVGLSGGVDSSVAALRLIKAGYTVVGVFIKVWHPDFLECNWEQERLDAMRVAAKLNIAFLTCDAEQAYKDDVAEYFIAEYKNGRTPNPDVMCNKYIKFGVFLKFAQEHGADFIATGHYAQCTQTKSGFELQRGIDTNKDQSYFLWTLTQEQLSQILLPVGNSTKDVIRKEAAQAGLITAEKKDSQGICFLGHVDIPDFLSHYIPLQTGTVHDESGAIVGTHRGAFVYTSGQRHGFTITTSDPRRKAYYVTSRDLLTNSIVVSTTKPIQELESVVEVKNLNLILYKPKQNETIHVQTRYRQKPTACRIRDVSEDSLTLQFVEEAELISHGQSCVLYKGMQCCGGGIIA